MQQALYTQKRFDFVCGEASSTPCDGSTTNSGDDLVSYSETKLDTDAGKEGPLQAPVLKVWGETTVRVDKSTVKFTWSAKGRPHKAALPAFDFILPRKSIWIWHSVWGKLICKDGIGYYDVDFVGSQFPSHRLWVNGAEVKTIKQGPFDGLWKPHLGEPTVDNPDPKSLVK